MQESPDIVLVNMPDPVPSMVLLSDKVGSSEVLQHIPLSVTAAPPLSAMFPPDFAVVPEIEFMVVVDMIGG